MRFFCWEKAPTGNWNACLYMDKPISKSSNGQLPDRSQLHEVPDNMTINEMIERYPAPGASLAYLGSEQ